MAQPGCEPLKEGGRLAEIGAHRPSHRRYADMNLFRVAEFFIRVEGEREKEAIRRLLAHKCRASSSLMIKNNNKMLQFDGKICKKIKNKNKNRNLIWRMKRLDYLHVTISISGALQLAAGASCETELRLRAFH